MKKFEKVAMNNQNRDYNKATHRNHQLYDRQNDLRSDFARDYTRIIFSQAYRRLKHKTQVFFAVNDDHVCTRIEHVNLVESVSYTIALELGLNTELTKAIAAGHDLGHAPFGHGGEHILTDISMQHELNKFWHEKNSLHFVDNIELLEDDNHHWHNLNLTYAVRDGIISHCGEMNQRYIQKRDEYIDLNEYHYAGEYNPWTYEGCVVKMADKIAYLARDIEDALRLHIIDENKVFDLMQQLNQIDDFQFRAINNGTVVNYFIFDVINNSNIVQGIGLSEAALKRMKIIMDFNYKNIYEIDRVKIHVQYVSLILNGIFDLLYKLGNNDDMIASLKSQQSQYPKLISHYLTWLDKYACIDNYSRDNIYENNIVYDFTHDKKALEKSIIDYLAGMSDSFLIQAFNEMITF
ncbi:MAG: HD domain-containing protein [Erysipelotrichaceae bacterium]|nr:HD domain-containing protein [Erysipelotrichaceae bacterium]